MRWSISESFDLTCHFERSYEPTQIQAGQITDTAFRSENCWYRDNGRVENYQGVTDTGLVAPTVDIGTVTITTSGPNNIRMIGSGTTFTTDLQRTCFVLINGDIYSIREINNDTDCYIDPPAQSSGTFHCFRTQIAVPFDVDFATLSSGSLELYQQAALLTVGLGNLYLTGTLQWPVKARLQVGIGSGASYTPFDAGLDTAPAAASYTTAAGTKNMKAGTYSVVLARRRSKTSHVGNAGPAMEMVNSGGQKFSVTFPAIDAPHLAQGQDEFSVFVSLQSQTSSGTTFLGQNGPWYKIADITGTGPFDLEWRNEELVGGETAQFDNDIPPDASFLATLNDVVVLLGCHGLNDTRPGPAIRASKPANPEAFPARAISYVNPAERIVGVLEAIGKLYPMTENKLHITTLTGIDASPLVTRPFWGSGFKHQQQAILVGDKIYGFSGGRPTRSGAEESLDQEDHTFAARVQDIVAAWNISKVFVAHDPKNKAVIFIHSNDQTRNGKKISVALAYMLETERWSGLFILKEPTNATDFVVTGTVTLSGALYVIANGKIWRWDTNSGAAVDWYITTPFLDADQPFNYKTITKVEVIGRTQSGTVGLFKNNDLTGLITGNSFSPAGSKALTTSSIVNVNTIWRTKMRQAKTFAVRVEGTWPGGNTPLMSVDEIAISGWATTPYF